MNEISDRLLAYYIKIMDEHGKSYDKEKMKEILEKVPPSGAEKLININAGIMGGMMGGMVAGPVGALFGGLLGNTISNTAQTKKRLLKYNDEISKFQQKQAEDMEELLNNVGDFDYSSLRYVEINGNKFSYDKDFPIDDYREELEKYGDVEKGEEYTVDLIDGRLVVY